MWTLNLFASSTNTTNNVSFYFNVFYTDSTGANKVVVASGSSTSGTVVKSQNEYTNSLYVPDIILPNLTSRIYFKVSKDSNVFSLILILSSILYAF
jgi:hypothetical protein